MGGLTYVVQFVFSRMACHSCLFAIVLGLALVSALPVHDDVAQDLAADLQEDPVDAAMVVADVQHMEAAKFFFAEILFIPQSGIFVALALAFRAGSYGFAMSLATWGLKADGGTPAMREVADAIREGARGVCAVSQTQMALLKLCIGRISQSAVWHDHDHDHERMPRSISHPIFGLGRDDALAYHYDGNDSASRQI